MHRTFLFMLISVSTLALSTAIALASCNNNACTDYTVKCLSTGSNVIITELPEPHSLGDTLTLGTSQYLVTNVIKH